MVVSKLSKVVVVWVFDFICVFVVVLDRCLRFHSFVIVVCIHCEDFNDVLSSFTSRVSGESCCARLQQ